MLRRLLLLFVCCFLCFASAPFAFAQGGEVPSIEQLDEQQQRELASLIDLAEANANAPIRNLPEPGQEPNWAPALIVVVALLLWYFAS